MTHENSLYNRASRLLETPLGQEEVRQLNTLWFGRPEQAARTYEAIYDQICGMTSHEITTAIFGSIHLGWIMRGLLEEDKEVSNE